MAEMNTQTPMPGSPQQTAAPGMSTGTETATAASPKLSEAARQRLTTLKQEVKPQLSDAWHGAMDAVSAQFSIWTLKATRLVVLAAFGVLGLFALLALFIYGFVLLDNAAWLALSATEHVWLAPLVRGAVYFLIPASIAAAAWHMFVGYGGADEEEEAREKAAAAREEVGSGI